MSANTQRFDAAITDGPVARAMWRLAWPMVLQNVLVGLQGIIGQAIVGHSVGFSGNAAVGIGWQIFLVVIVFINSFYVGMGILVARFAGARRPDEVNRVAYQAFLITIVLSGILAPLGYLLAPRLLDIVHATDLVRAEALPYLRILFMFSFGLLAYFLVCAALRAAGDARTPLYLGVVMTALNATLDVVLIRGVGPIPAYGTKGAAMGIAIASGSAAAVGMALLFSQRLPVQFSRAMSWRPDWSILRSLCSFGLPAAFQGIVMNVAGVVMLRFVGSLAHSAEAQASYAVCYSELFALLTLTANGLMGAAACVAGQNLGARRPHRSAHAVHVASVMGVAVAALMGGLFLTVPNQLLSLFGLTDPIVLQIGRELLGYLTVSGFFVAIALTYTGGLQGMGDTRSPLAISLISQIAVPLGYCATVQALGELRSRDVWLAIVLGHGTRCALSLIRFRQQNRFALKHGGSSPRQRMELPQAGSQSLVIDPAP